MNKKGKKTGEKAASELAEAISGLDRDPEFLASYWKSKFVEHVLEAMAEQKCSRKQLAKRLATSPQYVGRILNESANFTIETMVRLAVALGRQPYFGMHRQDQRIETVPAIVRPGVYFSLPRPEVVKHRLSEFNVVEKHPQTKLGGRDAGYPETGRFSTGSVGCQVA